MDENVMDDIVTSLHFLPTRHISSKMQAKACNNSKKGSGITELQRFSASLFPQMSSMELATHPQTDRSIPP